MSRANVVLLESIGRPGRTSRCLPCRGAGRVGPAGGAPACRATRVSTGRAGRDRAIIRVNRATARTMNRANIVLLVRINSEKYISKFAKTLECETKHAPAGLAGKEPSAAGMARKGLVTRDRGQARGGKGLK